MSAMLQNAKLSWNEAGTPVSESFGDVYFSNDNGLLETRYVFLQQNGLPERWHRHDRHHFVIAETGFGTGLNFLATWQLFNDFRKTTPDLNVARLHFISFEKYPLNREDLAKALDSWPELSEFSTQLIENYPHATKGCHRVSFQNGEVCLDLWFGDVKEQLPQNVVLEDGIVDAWFLDGFAPSKNPDMWSDELFTQMYRLCRPHATLATFTAAGFVRRGLAEVGFEMRKAPGYGKKREMLQGTCPKPEISLSAPHSNQPVTIIGSGLAAACLSYLLTRRNISVHLFSADSEYAASASGNPQGAIYPLLHSPEDTLSQFFTSAFDFCKQFITPIMAAENLPFDWSGIELRDIDEKTSLKNSAIAQAGFPEALVHPIQHGLWIPDGGWVCPAKLTTILFQLSEKSGLFNRTMNSSLLSVEKPKDTTWQLVFANGMQHSSEQCILALGAGITQLATTHSLPVTAVRGQISFLTGNDIYQTNHVICGDGYVVPALDGQQVIGATYLRHSHDRTLSESDHQENLQKMSVTVDISTECIKIANGRAAIRAVTRDHLPVVGGLREENNLKHDVETLNDVHWLPCYNSGLFVLGGLGSRGLCSAPLAAEIIVSLLLNEPIPASQNVLNDIDPQRRWLKPVARKIRKSHRQ